jgi:hypothetical protein
LLYHTINGLLPGLVQILMITIDSVLLKEERHGRYQQNNSLLYIDKGSQQIINTSLAINYNIVDFIMVQE